MRSPYEKIKIARENPPIWPENARLQGGVHSFLQTLMYICTIIDVVFLPEALKL